MSKPPQRPPPVKLQPLVNLAPYSLSPDPPVSSPGPQSPLLAPPSPTSPPCWRRLLCFPTFRKWWADHVAGRPVFVGLFIAFSLVIHVFLYYVNNFGAGTALGTPRALTCGNSGWVAQDCGLDGVECLSTDDEWHAFRCPQRCTWKTFDSKSEEKTRATPMRNGVYGGSPAQMFEGAAGVYAAKSRLCLSAIHAGVVDAWSGGCGRMRFIRGYDVYPDYDANGVQSLKGSWSPQSVQIAEVEHELCGSFEFFILFVSLVLMCILTLMEPARLVLFAYMVFTSYWYISFLGHQGSDSWMVLANSTKELCLLWGFAAFLWLTATRYSFFNHYQPWKRILFYILPWHLTMHLNLFIFFLPDFDITPDVFSQSTTVTVFVIVLLSVTALSMLQHGILLFKARKLLPLFVGYVSVLGLLGILTVLLTQAGYSIHLHHSFLPLVAWPMLRFRRWDTNLLQALLGGVWINGFVMWGFAAQFEQPDWLEPRPNIPSVVHYAVDVNSNTVDVGLTWERSQLAELPGSSMSFNEVVVVHDTTTYNYSCTLRGGLEYSFAVRHFGRVGLGQWSYTVYVHVANYSHGALTTNNHIAAPITLRTAPGAHYDVQLS